MESITKTLIHQLELGGPQHLLKLMKDLRLTENWRAYADAWAALHIWADHLEEKQRTSLKQRAERDWEKIEDEYVADVVEALMEAYTRPGAGGLQLVEAVNAMGFTAKDM